MKKILFAAFSLSLLFATDPSADAADGVNPQKADKADKKAPKSKGEKVTVVGTIKCTHCDFKTGNSCADVIKTDKAMYFLKGKMAKRFHKENPRAEKVEASGLARKDGEIFSLKVTKIAARE